MNLSLQEVIGPVAPSVGDAGADPLVDRAAIVEAINRAQRLLIHRLDSKGTVWPRTIPVCEEVFALPPEFLEVRSVLVNGRPGRQRDLYFEAHHGAKYEERGHWIHYCHGRELVDLGDGYALPTLMEQVRGSRIGLTAQFSGDAGKVVTMRVQDIYGNWITESLTLAVDQKMVFTTNECYDVKFVTKPKTEGNVNVFQVFADGNYVSKATYGPNVFTPSYRRKRLPKMKGYEEGHRHEIKIMGKLRYYPAFDDSDQLIIGNLDAIIWAVGAVTAQTMKNTAAYDSFLKEAVDELLHELADDESEATETPMEVSTGVSFNGRKGWR